MNNMTLREKIGQLIMMDFRNWGKNKEGRPVPFTKMNPSVSRLISEYNIGGLALFRENTRTPEQTLRLVDAFQNAAKIPLIVGIDQEGGIVTRIQKGTDMPGNMLLGAAGDDKLTEKVAESIADELRAQDINLDFAPVVDVNSNQNNPVIGVRSFGSDPAQVSRMSEAYIRGLKKGGVISCIKHFPGHGNTATDTHAGLATVDYSKSDMEIIDLKPFYDTIKSGADTVMIAHVIVPALDDSKCVSKKDKSQIGTPATLSEKIITGTLRNDMGFNGVAMTDALEMKAISDHFGNEEATIKTILAGADMAVMPIQVWGDEDIGKMKALIDAIEAEALKNPKMMSRINESVDRILKLKKEYGLLDKAQFDDKYITEKIDKANRIVGCTGHKNLESDVALKGITLIKNDNSILPFKLNNGVRILVLDANKLRLKIMTDGIQKLADDKKIRIEVKPMLIKYDTAPDDKIRNAVLAADYILLLTYNLNEKSIAPAGICEFASSNNKKLAVISCRNPYDIAYIPSCQADIAIYGAVGYDQTNDMQTPFAPNMICSIKYLFQTNGEKIKGPYGKLPVPIVNPNTGKVIYPIGHGMSYPQ